MYTAQLLAFPWNAQLRVILDVDGSHCSESLIRGLPCRLMESSHVTWLHPSKSKSPVLVLFVKSLAMSRSACTVIDAYSDLINTPVSHLVKV